MSSPYGRAMNVANDVKNLLSRFGLTSEGYLEVNDFPEYREPLRGESSPPGVTRERPVQAQGRVYLVAAPETVAAGHHAWLRSRLNASVTYGQAS